MCGHYVIILLYWIPLVEWCVVGFVSNDGIKKTCSTMELEVLKQI